MTSRQVGRRMDTIASQRRKKTARGGKRVMSRSGKSGAQRTARQKDAPLSPKEYRRFAQALICGAVFVALVAVKLLLPAKMTVFRETAVSLMQRNMDVQAVFSAVGRLFSGEDKAQTAMQEVYQAVFRPEQEETVLRETTVTPVASGSAALELLHTYRHDTPAPETTQAEPLGVIYTEETVPDDVSLEQAVLGFSFCTPVVGTLTSSFGYREHPIEGEDLFHYGIDLAANTGTAISCFADGTVTAVGESSSYGKYCIVGHESGYATLYAHCSKICTSSGVSVNKGEKIAEVGDTGMATGSHLHFELMKDGTYLNPIYYVSPA